MVKDTTLDIGKKRINIEKSDKDNKRINEVAKMKNTIRKNTGI